MLRMSFIYYNFHLDIDIPKGVQPDTTDQNG